MSFSYVEERTNASRIISSPRRPRIRFDLLPDMPVILAPAPGYVAGTAYAEDLPTLTPPTPTIGVVASSP